MPCSSFTFAVRSASGTPTVKDNSNNKSASTPSADAGGRALHGKPVAITGLHDVKVFSLPEDVLCCEKREKVVQEDHQKIIKRMTEAAELQSPSARLDA